MLKVLLHNNCICIYLCVFYSCKALGERSTTCLRLGLHSRTVTLRSVAPQTDPTENHDSKNEILGRPMSPHITIYKFPLPAMLSITHRGTGMALTAYMAALGIGGLVLPHDLSYYVDVIQAWQLSSGTITAAKFVLSYPFTFHLVNGIRHLAWDTGRGLKMKDVYASGYATLGIAAIAAAVISVV